MFSKVRRLGLCLIILPGLYLSSNSTSGNIIDDDIRIDVPQDGRVHVDNKFGDVVAEVWDKTYVSVSATVTNASSLNRSPIVIDNKGNYLAISTLKIPVNAAVTIDLKIKIPQSANLEVGTNKGKIVLRGLSASALLKTTTGDIEATINEPYNVNLTARSTRGAITSGFNEKPSTDDHLWQARLGAGNQRRTLDAQTDSGHLSFSPAPSLIAARSAPELTGTSGPARPAGTPANSNQSQELDEGDVIRTDSQLVTLNMSVIDRGTNRGLKGLTQTDFKLYENGEEQPILSFESSSAPFDLVLLMDLSGSTKEVSKLIRAAAQRFVDAARPEDRISVITFAADARVISPLTSDRELLRQRISTIDTEGGDTRIYDCLTFAMNGVTKDAKKSRRTAIILMSDGLDGTIPGVSGQYGSKLPYEEALRAIEEFDGVLYTLWLNTYYVALNPGDTQPEAFDMGHDRMKEMAERGGGIFYEVERLADLAGAYEQVVTDLGTVYSLAYRPSNQVRDGKWRAIKVTINRSNAVSRGKRGYYAN